MLPVIHTPTVGLACQEYGHIFRRPRGIFVSIRDARREILENWPTKNVQVIVVADAQLDLPGVSSHVDTFLLVLDSDSRLLALICPLGA
jgi:hypothetical protein